MTTIIKGLKFHSDHFRMKAEISAIREDKNEVDIIFTPSDGNAWVEKGCHLDRLKKCFEAGHYTQDTPNLFDISVY